MDESNATCGKRLASIGLENTEANRQAYRTLLVTAPGLGQYISGAILFEETLYQSTVDGKKIVDILTEQKIVPGIKVDKVWISLQTDPWSLLLIQSSIKFIKAVKELNVLELLLLEKIIVLDWRNYNINSSEFVLDVRVLCPLLAPTTSHGAKVSTALPRARRHTTSRALASPSGETNFSPTNIMASYLSHTIICGYHSSVWHEVLHLQAHCCQHPQRPIWTRREGGCLGPCPLRRHFSGTYQTWLQNKNCKNIINLFPDDAASMNNFLE